MVSFPLSNFTNNPDFNFHIQYGKHDQNLYMHHHEDYTELVIVLNGTAMHRVNEETFFIKKGDVFVINKETIHGYESPVDFEICNIMYQDDLLQGLSKDARQLMGFHGLFMIEPYFSKNISFQSRLKLSIHHYDTIHDLLENMLNEYKDKSMGWQDMVSAYFTSLIIRLSRLYESDHQLFSGDAVSIAKSIAYMESNFTMQISLDELANMSNVSTRHFNRIFKAIYHTTPMTYLLHLRLQLACKLLKTSSLNITEISLKTGFMTTSYFNRKFKNVYQMTPKQYRGSSFH